jgi:hypothetical protein
MVQRFGAVLLGKLGVEECHALSRYNMQYKWFCARGCQPEHCISNLLSIIAC